MENVLQSKWGAFGTACALFGIVGWLIYYVTRKITQFENKANKIDDIEKRLEKKIDKVDGKIDKLQEGFMEVKTYINFLRQENNPIAQRRSPISLTDKGEKIAKEINVPEIVKKHWKIIEFKVRGLLNDNCNPYDIQVASFSVAKEYQNYITNEELERIKENAFPHGLDLLNYDTLFGIIIRDEMIKRMGYDIKAIDHFDSDVKK